MVIKIYNYRCNHSSVSRNIMNIFQISIIHWHSFVIMEWVCKAITEIIKWIFLYKTYRYVIMVVNSYTKIKPPDKDLPTTKFYPSCTFTFVQMLFCAAAISSHCCNISSVLGNRRLPTSDGIFKWMYDSNLNQKYYNILNTIRWKQSF
jgi:hypothetical protein